MDYKLTGTKLPAGISKYQIPIITMADRAGTRRADVLLDHSAPPLMAVLARCLRRDAVLCSDRDPAYDFFARQHSVPHYRIDAKTNIPGFGKFKIKETAAREGRNPSTGATIQIAASKKLTVSSAKAVRDALNG